MKNKLATSYKLRFDKIVNRTHSHSAFSKYVIHIMLESYSYECILDPCYTCGRIYLLLEHCTDVAGSLFRFTQ